MTLPAPFRTLRGRLLGALGVAMGCLLGAQAFSELQTQRVGASLQVVDSAYLPLTRLAARMGPLTQPRDPAMAQTLAAAATVVEDAGRRTTIDEDRAALAAIDVQLDAIRAASTVGGRGVSEEIARLTLLLDARIARVTERTAQVHARASRISLALMGLCVLVAGAAFIAVRTAFSPVGALTEQARRVAGGARPPPLPVTGADEIATLADAFNRMIAALDERDRNLNALTDYLRRVLDGIRSAVVVVEGGVARVVNPAAGRLWGVAPGGRLPEGVASLGEGHHAEVPVGDARVHDVTVVPFGPDGRLFVAEDVTDRRRDRERLARSERLALVGQLLAQVTHEVRNPLNAMSLHAELLADTAMPDDARPLLTTIQAEILRLEDVTDRYLDLARRRPPELAPEDPVAVARSVIALEEASFRRAGIVGSVRTSTEGPTTAELDGNVVRRALLNLVRNALQSGARNIWIEVDRPPREARFVVADDGPGMPPEVAAHVFDPFFSTRARGTGLGLPITRQTVEDVGGSVALDTAPGAGTRVTLRFPTPE